jgi:hypothetical protein
MSTRFRMAAVWRDHQRKSRSLALLRITASGDRLQLGAGPRLRLSRFTRAPSLATTINCQIWTVEGSAARLGAAASAASDRAVTATLAERRGDQHGRRRHLGAPDAAPCVRWRGGREGNQPGGPIRRHVCDEIKRPQSPTTIMRLIDQRKSKLIRFPASQPGTGAKRHKATPCRASLRSKTGCWSMHCR